MIHCIVLYLGFQPRRPVVYRTITVIHKPPKGGGAQNPSREARLFNC